MLSLTKYPSILTLLLKTYGFIVLSILLSLLIFYNPNLLGDPENFIDANPLVTPVHIKPEWYFISVSSCLTKRKKAFHMVPYERSFLELFIAVPLRNWYPHSSPTETSSWTDPRLSLSRRALPPDTSPTKTSLNRHSTLRLDRKFSQPYVLILAVTKLWRKTCE